MDDEKLIECVRKYSCIYDMTDPKYLDTNHKSVTWKNIGEDLQQSGKYNLFMYLFYNEYGIHLF